MQHKRRTAAADAAWAEKAKEIKEGKRKSFIQMLDDRGLVNSVAGWVVARFSSDGEKHRS